jgi:hypothetical protein
MMTDTVDEDTTRALAGVASLLWHATQRVFADAAADGPRSPRYLMGVGLHAAWCDAAAALPEGTSVDPAAQADTDPVHLLRAARELASGVETDRPAVSALVVAIGDLLAELTR